MIFWDFLTQPSLGFTENSQRKIKYPVSGSYVLENASLMRGQWRMAQLVRAESKAKVIKITTCYN